MQSTAVQAPSQPVYLGLQFIGAILLHVRSFLFLFGT